MQHLQQGLNGTIHLQLYQQRWSHSFMALTYQRQLNTIILNSLGMKSSLKLHWV